jgi:hypothetical protein
MPSPGKSPGLVSRCPWLLGGVRQEKRPQCPRRGTAGYAVRTTSTERGARGPYGPVLCRVGRTASGGGRCRRLRQGGVRVRPLFTTDRVRCCCRGADQRGDDCARHVPVCATLVAGALVLLSTIALPFESLLRLSTTLTLLVFALVSLSLWRLQQSAPRQDLDFYVPRWVPIAAALGSIGLIAAQFTLA